MDCCSWEKCVYTRECACTPLTQVTCLNPKNSSYFILFSLFDTRETEVQKCYVTCPRPPHDQVPELQMSAWPQSWSILHGIASHARPPPPTSMPLVSLHNGNRKEEFPSFSLSWEQARQVTQILPHPVHTHE